MPELPEVETVRLQLLRKVCGKTVARVIVHHPKTVAPDKDIGKKIAHKTIEHIDRVGKLMIFSFRNDNDMFILAHLKMTGQFFFVDTKQKVSGGGHSMTESDIQELPNKHTRVSFYFTDGSALHFNDMRLFGYIKIANAKEVTVTRSRCGPEPIQTDFDIEYFYQGLKRRKTTIKAVLLDQSFVAGLGNIYVDEALFAAGVRPMRRANKVTKKEAAAIAAASGDIMNDAIAVGGTTFQHFVDTGGDNGNYTDYLKVFGKQNTPCSRCGTELKKIRTAGRGTHYCPRCQK